MDEALREKLLASRGCGVCVIDFAENMVKICDEQGGGKKCETATINTIIDFIEARTDRPEFVEKMKKIFDKNRNVDTTVGKTTPPVTPTLPKIPTPGT